jgi:hypothetical protein
MRLERNRIDPEAGPSGLRPYESPASDRDRVSPEARRHDADLLIEEDAYYLQERVGTLSGCTSVKIILNESELTCEAVCFPSRPTKRTEEAAP